jgi:hypothetical protein
MTANEQGPSRETRAHKTQSTTASYSHDATMESLARLIISSSLVPFRTALAPANSSVPHEQLSSR